MRNLAAVCTTWFTPSHADVLLRRWLDPEPGDARLGWRDHGTRVATVHVSQPCDEDDQAALRIARHGLARANSIREAVAGGSGPRADGVLVIAEHGRYPLNEFGQKLYPRREMFDEVLDALEADGRRVPVFLDKHLSWDLASILHMDRRRREAGIPFMAGSVLPWCRLDPPLDAGVTANARDAVCVFYGGQEIYGFHALEFAQSVLERRDGGEPGICGLRVWRGAAVAGALESHSRPELLHAAWESAGATGSPVEAVTGCTPLEKDGFYIRYSNSLPIEPIAFETRHRDGLRVFHAMLPGAVSKFSLAVRGADGRIGATRAVMHGSENFHGHFAAFAGGIARFMADGIEPHPPERNFLTSLVLAAVMRSLSGRSVDDILEITAGTAYLPGEGAIR